VQVEIRHEGGTDMLEVGDGDSILDAAIDAGLAMSHDCKMGVCMTCPARLVRRYSAPPNCTILAGCLSVPPSNLAACTRVPVVQRSHTV